MRKAQFLIIALAVAGFAGSAAAQTLVAGDINVDTTWGGAANPCPIILDGPVTVSDGGAAFADGSNVKTELTIFPGCVVRGQPRTGPNDNEAPGSLIVTQTGRINAIGDPKQPIIFTTAATDNNDDGIADPSGAFLEEWQPGDVFLDDSPESSPLAPLDAAGQSNVSLWGGVVLQGLAPVNTQDVAACGTGIDGLCQVEGLQIPGIVSLRNAVYGGNEVHDSCGEMNYVSIRHGGDEIGTANEINGLTIGGCGDATEIGFVEVYANFDDGVEWFGGTAGGHHLAVTFAGDDSLDTDLGHTGIVQFALAIQSFFGQVGGGNFGSSSSDKIGEWDGDDCNDKFGCIDRPLEDFWAWNVTGIGSKQVGTVDFTPAPTDVDGVDDNRGVQMRNGFGGALLNSVIVNTTNDPFDLSSGGSLPGRTVADRVARCEVQSIGNTFDDDTGVTSFGALEDQAIACGDALGPVNVVNNAGFNGLVNADTSFDPQGDANGKLSSGLKNPKIDPTLAFGFVGTSGGLEPVGSFLDPSATYRGAFDGSLPGLWTDHWTVLNLDNGVDPPVVLLSK